MKQFLKATLTRLHLEFLLRLYKRLRAMIPPVIRANMTLLYGMGLSLLKKPHIPEKRFVIISRGRSGSTLLVNLLKSHKHIHCDSDILIDPVLFPKRYVDIRASMREGVAYGFKILTYQLQEVQPFLHPRRFILHLHESGYKFIYLTRADLLRYALSNIYARQIHFHSRVSDGPPERKAIRVDVEDVLNWFQESELRASLELELLEDIPYLSITYEEDLLDSESHQGTIDRICEFIGVLSAPVSTDLQKTTPKALSDLVLNFEELSEALADTPYGVFVSDT